ncbi:MAG TPA: VanZ family protein [Thermoanaerobaculia bacterium]|nr:VanZ family protein [Thermoanaerobaculia bacterium]
MTNQRPIARRWVARSAAALWALLIAALLLVPLPPEQEDYLPGWLARLIVPGFDKVVHGALFFGFAYFLLGALDTGRWRKPLAFLVAVAYGALTEWLQPRISGRSGEWNDLLADAAGALAGVVTVWAIEIAKKRSRERSARLSA